MSRGFSVLEVMLAAGIFAVFAIAAVVAVISGFDANRLASEQVVATQYASEGLEAVRSIKNRGFYKLVDSAGTGVAQSGGVWIFSGANNTFDSRYTRVITISDVCRDGSGNIIACGSPVDVNTKKITSRVTWSFTSARPLDVTLTEYLSSWKSPRGGVIVYGDGTTTPKFRNFDFTNGTNAFNSQQSTVVGASGLNFVVRTSPLNKEAVAGYVNSSGTLQIMCYNGTTWGNEWSVAVGGTGTTKRFSIAYEANSGDAMVAYSSNATATNGIKYRTKLGTATCGGANWSAEQTNFPTTTILTTGVVQWVRLEADPRSSSNNVAIAWNDNTSKLGAAIWNGSSWGNLPASLETNLERVTAAGDSQSFDLAFESQTGNVVVAWGVLTTTTACTAGSNCIRYSRWNGSTWLAATVIPTVADGATNIDLSSNPNTNEMILAAIDNGPVTANLDDLSIAYWSGSAWTGNANVDTSTADPVAGTKLLATGWLINGSTTRSIVVYNDSAATNIGWYVCNAGTCTLQTDFSPTPAFGNPQKWYDVQTDPFNKEQLLFTLADTNSDLFAKKLVMTSVPAFTWTNADNSVALTVTLGQATVSPFSFAYWRAP